MQAEDECKWGSRVTFYKASLEKLGEAIKIAKSLNKSDVCIVVALNPHPYLFSFSFSRDSVFNFCILVCVNT